MLLHLLVLAPFAAAILMMATSKEDPKSSSRLAFLFGFTFVALSISLIAAGNQATEAIEWFRIPGAKGPVYYYLYSHGLGAWMVFLSTGLSLVALITGRNTFENNYRNFAIAIFALMGAMNGTFLAADAVLFFFFFEAMVFPAAVLIAGFGGADRKKAAMTFAIYTLVGSAPMMVALWYLLTVADNSLVLSLAVAIQNLEPSMQVTLLVCFLLAFLVKTPLFPFHGWQAITYAEAPAPLSAILTGAMSKAGVFGFIAWILPIFPLSMEIVDSMLWLGLFTAIYGSLMALRATDGKKLLAYSSMGHLGLAVAGVFSLSESMLPAVLVLLVAHGLSAGAQFYLMGIAERFAGTRNIEQLGGQHTPALGFGMGIERLLIVMDKQNCDYLKPRKCDLYFATMGDEALEEAMELSNKLREFGYFAEYDIMGRGLKAQMKYANKIGAAFTIVLGENELNEGKAKLKEMESGEESEIRLNDKFPAAFEEIYMNKMLGSLEEETNNGSLFAFTDGTD